MELLKWINRRVNPVCISLTILLSWPKNWLDKRCGFAQGCIPVEPKASSAFSSLDNNNLLFNVLPMFLKKSANNWSNLLPSKFQDLFPATLFEIFIFLSKYSILISWENCRVFFWLKNSWKCLGFRHFSCWQLWFHEKNCQKKFGWKTRENVGVVSKLSFWTKIE